MAICVAFVLLANFHFMVNELRKDNCKITHFYEILADFGFLVSQAKS